MTAWLVWAELNEQPRRPCKRDFIDLSLLIPLYRSCAAYSTRIWLVGCQHVHDVRFPVRLIERGRTHPFTCFAVTPSLRGSMVAFDLLATSAVSVLSGASGPTKQGKTSYNAANVSVKLKHPQW